MFLTPDKAIGQITKAVEDAKARLGSSNFHFLSWPQTWGSTACGFGGIAGQAFTEAQTVLISGESDACLVYHAGRFAYEVPSQTDEFLAACGQRSLPGAAGWPQAKVKLGYKD